MINLNLAERRRATQATFDAFAGVAFDWRGATCIHALHFHLEQMGHEVPPVPEFRSPSGARKALKAMGATNLVGLLRLLDLDEIAPARMIVGDVTILQGDAGSGVFDSVAICAGNKFMGWSGGAEGFQALAVSISGIKAAFRC